MTYEFFDEENQPIQVTTAVNTYDLSKNTILAYNFLFNHSIHLIQPIFFLEHGMMKVVVIG